MDGKIIKIYAFKFMNRAIFSFFYLLICDYLPLQLITLMYSASYQKSKKFDSSENLIKGR